MKMARYVRRSARLQTSTKRNTKSPTMPIRRVLERPVLLKPERLVSLRPVALPPVPVMPVTLPCGIIRPTPERGYVHRLDNNVPDEQPIYASIVSSAAREGNHELIQCCIRLYDDIQPKYLVLALDIAAKRGHLDCVEVLLEVDDTRWSSYLLRSTALSDAWNAGHYNVVKVLIEDGRFRARIIQGDGDIKELTSEDIPKQIK